MKSLLLGVLFAPIMVLALAVSVIGLVVCLCYPGDEREI
jgi:hypothetical protein